MTEPIKDEKIAEIKAGCKGVTKGPWKHFDKQNTFSVYHKVCDDIVGWSGFDQSGLSASSQRKNSAHIARMDPDTVLSLIARIEAQDKRIKGINHESTNKTYRIEALTNMLGPVALKVAHGWIKSGVTRMHFDWGPKAGEMSGEERAQLILDIEKLPPPLIALIRLTLKKMTTNRRMTVEYYVKGERRSRNEKCHTREYGNLISRRFGFLIQC